jgi:hypothetical protein
MTPASGIVAGVDIGFSTTRRSSAICKLWWDTAKIGWSIRRYRATASKREAAFREALNREKIVAIALDGPVRCGFDLINDYRVAERNLTRLLQPKIGKPGQSNSPVGRQLNQETNVCAELALRFAEISAAKHHQRIHERSIIEAFPSSFLGVMLPDPKSVVTVRAKRSDVFYKTLVASGKLRALLEFLLPERAIGNDLNLVTNHDDRAALICAVTAIGVAAGKFCAVGDPKNGWIILPPPRFIAPWADKLLNENGVSDQSYYRSCQ